MSSVQLVYDPTAPTQHAAGGLTARQLRHGLRGAVVGFIDNAKPNFEHLVAGLAEILPAQYGVARILTRRKRGAAMPAPGDYIDALAAECDLVITGSGD